MTNDQAGANKATRPDPLRDERAERMADVRIKLEAARYGLRKQSSSDSSDSNPPALRRN